MFDGCDGSEGRGVGFAVETPVCQVFGVVLDLHVRGFVRREMDGRDGARRGVLSLQIEHERVATPVAQPVVREAELPPPPRKPGRPKLGVVAREITLLPRHWDWLSAQPGGASVALRKLVEEARRVSTDDDIRRAAQETSYRFMLAMMGDAPGFEDAARALFAGNIARFEQMIVAWPEDVRDHVTLLATDAFLH